VQRYNQIECTKKRKKNDLPVLWRRCGWWQRGGPPPLIAFTPAFLCFYAHCPLFFLCFSLLSQSLWWWIEDGAGFSFQFGIWVLCWVFLCRDVCRDEGNNGNNSLCILDSFPLLLSVYYFFAPGFLLLFWLQFFRSWLCIFFLGCVLCALFFWVDCSVFLGLFGFLGFIFLPPVAVFFFLFLLWFLIPFIEKLAPQPVLPLQDCYSNYERDHGQETTSTICCRFPVESASSAQT